ncbi:dedicator of cytokinesis [Anaeramoeba ignava]|uniref:Dedicator of cytokinesis n=1 Tax=Anaeramoeba ignava TaxID=1746090 RepID=A0A9Q0REY5_ANAIG|nr:dedicator of cytokinesis [Anaeramoeba ignava]
MTEWEITNQYGVALYDFIAQEKQQLSIKFGEYLIIKEKNEEWFRVKEILTKKHGIVPQCYIKVLEGEPPTKEILAENNYPGFIEATPAMIESEDTLIEWKYLMKDLCFFKKDFVAFEIAKTQIYTLLKYRQNLLQNQNISFSSQQILRNKLIEVIENGRKTMNLPLLPRMNNEKIATEKDVGIVKLFDLHSSLNSQKESSDLTLISSQKQDVVADLFQFLFEFNMAIVPIGSDAELHFFLYSQKSDKVLSESYVIPISRTGMHEDINKHGTLKTIFRDISKEDLNGGLYLVCKIIKYGVLLVDEKIQKKYSKVTPREYRKPFGAGIFQLPLIHTTKQAKQESTIKIFTCTNDIHFFKIHKMIINEEQSMKPVPSPGVSFTWSIFAGDYDTVLKEQEEIENSEEENQVNENQNQNQNENQNQIQNENQNQNQNENQNQNQNENQNQIQNENQNQIQNENQNQNQNQNNQNNQSNTEESKKMRFRDISFTLLTKLPEIILPSYIRNDLYIEITGGEFVQERKRTPRNIELRISLRLNDFTFQKDFIKEGLSFGTSSDFMETYKSYVFYHKNNPQWKETLKITMPSEMFANSHLYIEVIHCTTNENHDNKTFAFGFLKFFDKDNFIPQGELTINTFRYNPKLVQDEPNFYMQPPGPETTKKLIARKETISFNINLCSTILTQDSNVTQLFNWKKHPLPKILQDMTISPPYEIIKCFREILDTLFIILGQQSNNFEQKMKITQSIEYVIGIVVDKRFKHYSGVLNDYIRTRFHVSQENQGNDEKIMKAYGELQRSLCKTYTHFIEVLTKKLENIAEQDRTSLLLSMRAIEYTFRFIIYSWSYNIKEHPQEKSNQPQFKKNIQKILSQIRQLLSLKEPVWINAVQAMALRHFKNIFSILGNDFTLDELTQEIKLMIESVRKEDQKNLNQTKLEFIASLLKAGIFQTKKSRSIIIPVILNEIQFHTRKSEEESELCLQIIIILLENINKIACEKPNNSNENIQGRFFGKNKYCRVYGTFFIASIYFQIVAEARKSRQISKELVKLKEKTKLKTTQYNNQEKKISQKEIQVIKQKRTESKIKLFNSLIQIFYMIDSSQMENLYINFSKNPATRLFFFFETFTNFLEFHKMNLFQDPKDFHMKLIHYRIIFKTLSIISHIMRSKITGGMFNLKIWELYFQNIIELIKSENLQLEKKTYLEQYKIMETMGDLRLVSIALFNKNWNSITGHRFELVSVLAEECLSLVLFSNEKLKQFGIEIFYSMLISEIEKTDGFSLIEQCTIDKIDQFIREGKDQQFKDYFFIEIEKKFGENKKHQEKCNQFVQSLNHLIHQISKLKDYPQSEKFQEERAIVLLALMDYLKKTRRYGMYSKYAHLLAELYQAFGYETEAGLVLMEVNKIIAFNDDKFEEKLTEGSFNYPRETYTERKERILHNAVDLFDKGKFWENGIQLLDILRDHYELKTFDYAKLSSIIRTKSEMFRRIASSDRFFASYFLVGYYGNGFNSEIYLQFKDKEFVYRGKELEQLSVFIERMKSKFPEAQVISKEPDLSMKNSEGKFLLIASLTPSTIEEIEEKEITFPSKMNTKIRKFYENNQINVFKFSKPFRKTDKKSDNEFKDLWLRTTYLLTEEKFPTIKHSIVVSKKIIQEIPPIINAIQSVEQKNSELKEIIEKYKNTKDPNINPFSMALNGVIDAAVNGGVFKYQDAFFNPQFLKEDHKNPIHVSKLKNCLKEQQSILDDGILLHSKICPPPMKPFHDKLQTFLQKMKELLLPSLDD